MRDHPNHGSVARLRRREFGLQLMSVTTAAEAEVLAAALPGLKLLHGKIVVVSTAVTR